MKSIKLVLVTAALAVSGAAVAGPSYTYVDLGLTSGDSVGNGEETKGLELRGSFGFADIFHVGGGFGDSEIQGGSGKGGVDAADYNIYLGFNPAATEDIDLVARVGYSRVKFEEAGNFDAEVKGLTLEVGPRAMIGEKLELNAAVTALFGELEETLGCASDCRDDLTELGFRVGGEYYFTPAISVGVDASQNGLLGDMINLHGRYSFGNN